MSKKDEDDEDETDLSELTVDFAVKVVSQILCIGLFTILMACFAHSFILLAVGLLISLPFFLVGCNK